MKKTILLLYLIFVLPISLLSQYESSSLSNFSWQFSLGMGSTFHYAAPVAIQDPSFRTLTSQEPRKSFHINIALNQKISKNQEVFIGAGVNSINFYRGLYPPFSSFLTSKYVSNIYYGICGGHQFYFLNRKNSSLFISNSLFNDFIKSSNSPSSGFFKGSGFSYQLKFGLKLKYLHQSKKTSLRRIHKQLNKVTDVFFNVFYKTAITPYNKIKYNKNYFPYYWGFEIGYVFKMKKR